MEDFIYQVKKAFRKYKIEVILISASFIIMLIAVGLYVQDSKKETDVGIKTIKTSPLAEGQTETTQEKMYVDISGSVLKPDMYEVETGTRLKHVLDLAGGLSPEADQLFFSRSFNLSKRLQDTEKIYIPSTIEVLNGSYMDQINNVSNGTSTNTTSTPEIVEENSTKISINNASLEELDTLPGIGKTTAEKIMDNRPYESIQELTDNKVVNNATFEKIKDLITE